MNFSRSQDASEVRKITVRPQVAPRSNGLATREGIYEACAEGPRLRLGRIL